MIVLFHILDDAFGLARALVLFMLALLVHADGRIPAHALLAAKLLVVRAVNGGKGDLILLQSLSGLGILGRQGLAMAAPVGIELDKHGLLALHGLFKVGGGELDDVRVIEGLFQGIVLVNGEDGGGVEGSEGDEGVGEDAHLMRLN